MNTKQHPEYPFRVVRKRNRVPLSCGPCRHRKLKCDRSNPCQNCVKRAEAPGCIYATPPTRKRSTLKSSNAINSSDDMQNRIDRLEGLVLSLMTNGSQSAGPNAASRAVTYTRSSTIDSGQQESEEVDETEMLDNEDEEDMRDDSDTDKVTKSFGMMKVDSEKKTVYYGEGHWAAVLHSIAEVRNFFQTHKNQFAERKNQMEQDHKEAKLDPGSTLLFDSSKAPPRSDILSQLPSRYLTDILVARYFSAHDPAIHVIHGLVFKRQYNEHWADPSKTSIVWIAMLFSMLRISLLSYYQDCDEPPEFAGKSLELSNTFSRAVANCLVLADYTKPHQYIIETLIYHLHAEYCKRRESEASVWVLVGMIVRLAMRMGYHRDSKMFPNITAYEGEMRRRIWTFLRQSDILFSFQMSHPGMIRIGDSDTELPRNIHDEEFDEDTISLPPSRPISEPTATSYLITKARLAFGFGRVLEEVDNVSSERYEEILKIDKGLREILDDIPGHLKVRSIDEQFRLSPEDAIACFRLAAIYHKSQCVLHRKFLRYGRSNSRYDYSRQTCLQSAMALISFQRILHRKIMKSEQLSDKTSWLTSLTSHDFLLAATIISMYLYEEKRRAQSGAASTTTSPPTNMSDSNSNGTSGRSGHLSETSGTDPSQEDLLGALEQSRNVWSELQDESMQAYKASELLNLLCRQLSAKSSPDRRRYSSGEKTYQGICQTAAQGLVDEKQNAAMTLGLLSSGGKSPTGSITGQPTLSQKIPGVFDSSNPNEGFFQPNEPPTNVTGPMPGLQNMAANSVPFFNMFGAGANDTGGAMNWDWNTFNSYIQPSNLGLDPANTLWPSFSQTANPFPANPSTMTGRSRSTAPEISSALYPPLTNQTAYDPASISELTSSGSSQNYSEGPFDSPIQASQLLCGESRNPCQAATGMPTSQLPCDERSNPCQAATGMPTSQSLRGPNWKWNYTTT